MLKRLMALALGVVFVGIAVLALARCGGDEECLVSGENCSSSYKQTNYGTTSIYCCAPMSCVTSYGGYDVCR